MYLPEGSFAPVPTPLTSQGEFDRGALRTHLAWLAREGLQGALILGSGGEFSSLTLAERADVAQAAGAPGTDFKLILNVGACALPEALELAGAAAGWGYDALLCPPPFYFRNAHVEGLAAFLREVLDASELPVLLYHFPQMTGIEISDDLLLAIGEHERLAGVKDSSGDLADMERLAARFQHRAYLVGDDRLIGKCLESGGKGSITAAACVVPDLVRSIRTNPGQQGKLNTVRGLLEKFGLLGSIKAILHQKEFGEYASRPPQVGLTQDQRGQLFRMLDMFGVVKW